MRRLFRGHAAPGAVTAAACVLLATACTADAGDSASLEHWPAEAADQLEGLIAEHGDSGEYAAFDADNTIWKHDLEESLIPYLENEGVLTRDNLDPQLKIVSFEEDESLYAYYNRLCDEAGTPTCYAWAAQAYSGLSLGEVKGYVDDLMKRDEPVATNMWEDGELVDTEVATPEIYPAMKELIHALHEADIEVYVVTAAHEELNRMVVTDPDYGLDIPTGNVLGVQTLLENPGTGDIGTRVELNERDIEVTDDFEFTAHLSTPVTWQSGKAGVLQERVDPVQRPVLTGGDSSYTDEHLLFRTDMDNGGLRIFVNRKEKYTSGIKAEAEQRAERQKELGLDADAEDGWIFVDPAELGIDD
ncbi:phosphorylcholine phosphatase [Nocardiopsis rhodophaea]|uniref:Phosphorylcholine phosphatase n=1 Tax=Nocardiopsis rhodophaea TaxID=280238 RepID=A0ABP5EPG7_9ACTN